MKIQRTFAPCLAVIASLTLIARVSLAMPPEIEHFCSPTEVIEAWVNPAQIPWRLCTGPSVPRIAPGFPAAACSFPDDDETKHPAYQSLARAIAAWQVCTPGGGPCTLFSMPISPTVKQPAPGLGQDDPGLVSGTDGFNTITLWQKEGWFTAVGSDMTLAVSAVSVDVSSGAILDADIALNARSQDASFAPSWSFVEVNDMLSRTFATHDLITNPTQVPVPVVGFADLQGVLTHELGHFAGLAHSLIDSSGSPTASQTPTMFPRAHIQPFEATVSKPGGCGSYGLYPVTGAGSLANGILGVLGRTLEWDDEVSIVNAYPDSTSSLPGTITGWVRHVDSMGPLEEGVHVVAVGRAPDAIRVGTLAYDGSYTIENLAAGRYFLYIEGADQDPVPNPTTPLDGYYFPFELDVPNFLSPGAGGCVAALPVPVPIEFWNADDDAVENNMKATRIDLFAGTTTYANFVINQAQDVLTVRSANSSGHWSPRGLEVNPVGGVFPSFELRILATPLSWVEVYLDFERVSLLDGNQLRQVLGSSAKSGVPSTLSGKTNPSGELILQFVFDPASTAELGYRTVFAQAGVDVGGTLLLTNCLTLAFTRP